MVQIWWYKKMWDKRKYLIIRVNDLKECLSIILWTYWPNAIE